MHERRLYLSGGADVHARRVGERERRRLGGRRRRSAERRHVRLPVLEHLRPDVRHGLHRELQRQVLVRGVMSVELHVVDAWTGRDIQIEIRKDPGSADQTFDPGLLKLAFLDCSMQLIPQKLATTRRTMTCG